MKKSFLFTFSFLSLAILLTQCSKSDSYTSSGGGAGTGNTITISGMSYSPSSKTVAKGTVVKWTNSSSSSHTATSNDGTTFNTGDIPGGSSATYTANTPGTFAYHCLIHGTSMAGTLIVTP